MTTALIVLILALAALVALTAALAWDEYRGIDWLNSEDFELDEYALRLTEREWDQIQHAHDYPLTPRRINGEPRQGGSR